MLRNDNPMIRALMLMLYFEVVVFGLSVAVMIMVDGTRPVVAGIVAGVAGLLALVAGATIKKTYGQVLGWVAQVAGIALGFVTPVMFVVGGIFAALYLTAFILGRRIETGPAAG